MTYIEIYDAKRTFYQNEAINRFIVLKANLPKAKDRGSIRDQGIHCR